MAEETDFAKLYDDAASQGCKSAPSESPEIKKLPSPPPTIKLETQPSTLPSTTTQQSPSIHGSTSAAQGLTIQINEEHVQNRSTNVSPVARCIEGKSPTTLSEGHTATRKTSTVVPPKESELIKPTEATTVDQKCKRSLIISNKEADEKWNCQISKAQKSKATAEAQEQIMQHCNQCVKEFETDMLGDFTVASTKDVDDVDHKVASTIKTPDGSKPREAEPVIHPGTQPPGFGFTYLEKLLRLMEQLAQLREENSSLKRRCEYLRDTRELLEIRNQMLTTKYQKTPRIVRKNDEKRRSDFLDRQHLFRTARHGVDRRKRCSSDGSDEGEATSDKRRPHKVSKLQHRSLSVGSLNMDTLNCDVIDERRSRSSEKPSFPYDVKLDGSKVLHKVTSRLHRMKKVIRSKVESSETFTAAISAEQLVKANTKMNSPVQQVTQHCSSESTTTTSSSVKRQVVTSLPGGIPGGRSDSSTTGSISTDTSSTHHAPPGGAIIPPSPNSISSDTIPEQFPSPQITSTRQVLALTMPTKPNVFNFDPKVIIYPSSSSPVDPTDEKSSKRDDYHLTVEGANANRRRRQSSPALSTADGERTFVDEPPPMRRAGSYKVFKKSLLETEYEEEQSSRGEGTNKSPWGRVKNIIHTRKDSLQKRTSGGESSVSPESSSPPAVVESPEAEGIAVSKIRGASISQDDSASSPKSILGSPVTGSGSPTIDISTLLDGMSNEYAQKMQEWEDKKRKFSVRGWQDDSSKTEQLKFSKDFIKKMEEWERIKGLTESSTGMKEEYSSEKITTHQMTMQSQKQLSESFSKTVQEWERVKTKRIKETSTSPGSSVGEKIDRMSRKMERGRSRERDRSKNKYERQIELQKSKLEKKTQKIEKERQKLEKMQQKFDESSAESTIEMSGSTIKIRADFAQKIKEWDQMKRIETAIVPDEARRQRQSVANPPTSGWHQQSGNSVDETQSTRMLTAADAHHHRSHSAKESRVLEREDTLESDGMKSSGRERSRSGSEGQTGVISRTWSMPSLEMSQVNDVTQQAKVDDSTSIDLSLTNTETNVEIRQLRLKLAEKQDYISDLQDELQQLTERITEMDQDHVKHIAHYKRELWACSSLGHFTIESEVMTAQLERIKEHIQQLHRVQRTLINEKQELQCDLKTAEETITKLESEKSQKSKEQPAFLSDVEPEDFGTLFTSFTTLNREVEDLRCNLLERDQLIESLRHHMTSHDLATRLLYAQLVKQKLELDYLRGQRKRGAIRRCKTFSGTDVCHRQVGSTCPESDVITPRSMFDGDLKGQLLNRLNRVQAPTHHVSGSAKIHHSVMKWLRKHHDTIKGVASKEAERHPTYPGKKQQSFSTRSAQTVMTLSNIPYIGRSSLIKPPGISVGLQTGEESINTRSSLATSRMTSSEVATMEGTTGRLEMTKNVMHEKNVVETKLFHHPLKRLPKIAYDSPSDGDAEPTGHPAVCNLDVTTPQTLPHSPIIRSKYVRKQRSSAPGNGDSENRPTRCTPKRFIRNKKTTDAKSVSSEEIRHRTRSDGATARPPRPEVMPPDLMSKCKRDSRYSSADETEGSVKSGSRTPKCHGSPSINKPTRSPVRKLKTAAELLEESRKSSSLPERPRCHSLDVPRDDGEHSSVSGTSDKENNRYSTVSDYDSGAWVVIEDSSSDIQSSQPLQDVTNSDVITSTTTTTSQSASPQSAHSSKSPRTRRQLFQSRRSDDAKATSTSSSRPESGSSLVWLSRKDNPHHSSSAQDPDAMGPSSQSPGPPPSSPLSPTTIERRLYRLFGKHFNSPSPLRSPNRGGGALNTLCKQTLSVDLDSSSGGEEAWHSSPPSSPGAKSGGDSSPDAISRGHRSGRARFLDRNWLQKPKKFFKF